MTLREAVVAAATHDWMAHFWKPLVRDRVALMMFHRFADAERGVPGHNIAQLRRNLELLRRQRVHVASMPDLLADDGRSSPSGLTVAFTVDDGYDDFYRVAAPVFAEFDYPTTVFLVTDVVENRSWFWWDRVEHVVGRAERTALDLDLSGHRLTWRFDSARERATATSDIIERLKSVPNAARLKALDEIVNQLGVELPDTPPARFSPMTWDEVERCTGGVSFAPHTATHPMLPTVAPEEAHREIIDSWTVLRARCGRTVPVFCYPSGVFTAREVGLLASSGLAAAVTTEQRYTTRAAFRSADPSERYRIPRFAYSGNPGQFAQIITGFERLKLGLRPRDRRAAPRNSG